MGRLAGDLTKALFRAKREADKAARKQRRELERQRREQEKWFAK